jgi:hypothetical protein
MQRCLGVSLALCLTLPLLGAPAPKTSPITYIEFQDLANCKLSENLHSENYPNNNLQSLKQGEVTLGEVKFKIGDKLLQLSSSQVVGKPDKFEGIKVGRTAKKLHFLQACGYGTDEEKNKAIGKYIIRYEDKSKEKIEIVYGKDIVDWWAYPSQTAPSKGKVAWEGENEASKGFEAKIKLYLMTWENPKPDKVIKAIDFVTLSKDLSAAPFCVAITAENP